MDNAYVGNTTDLGNAFLPYHIRLRKILEKGLKEEEKKLMIKEIEEINILLDNSLKKQDYMEMKTLTGIVAFYSVSTALTFGEERKENYDKGLSYVDIMKTTSPENKIIEISKALLDVSLKYGEEGLSLLNTDKNKVQ